MDYTDDLSPHECWALLRDEKAILIDVRTKAEWSYVGIPLVEEGMKPPIFHEWQQYPEMHINPQYTQNLSEKLDAIGGSKSTPLCFLCRSGVRSKSAAKAMTKIGYDKCFNIIGGFEGQQNENAQRGTNDGWKFDGLPWKQN